MSKPIVPPWELVYRLRDQIEGSFPEGYGPRVVDLQESVETATQIARYRAAVIADAVIAGRVPARHHVEGYAAAQEVASLYRTRVAEIEEKECRDLATVEALGLERGMRLRWTEYADPHRDQLLEGVITYINRSIGQPIGFAYVRRDDGGTSMVYLLHARRQWTLVDTADAALIA